MTASGPWWKRTRCWAAIVAVWLVLPMLYTLSDALAAYGEGRGWWRYPSAVYAPLDRAVDSFAPSPVREVYIRYYLSAYALGQRHAASD